MISQDGCKKTTVGQILGSETVDQKPVKYPRHCLCELLRASADKWVPLSKFLLNEFFHFLEGCVLNNISSLSIKNLTCKESPEYLKHKLRVLLALVNKDLLKREK